MGNLPRRSARQFAPLNHAGAPPHYQGQHPKGREAQRRPLKSTSLTPETLVRPQAVTFKGKTPTATEHLPSTHSGLRHHAPETSKRALPLHTTTCRRADARGSTSMRSTQSATKARLDFENEMDETEEAPSIFLLWMPRRRTTRLPPKRQPMPKPPQKPGQNTGNGPSMNLQAAHQENLAH